jgi:hypothetical protein
MGEPARWYELACPCGSALFVKTYTIRAHSGGGSSDGDAGKQCAACGLTADTGAMWKRIQLQRQRQQLADLEQQIAGEEALSDAGAPDSKTAMPNSSS